MALSLAGQCRVIQGVGFQSRAYGRSKRAARPRVAIRAAAHADQPTTVPDALQAIISGNPTVEQAVSVRARTGGAFGVASSLRAPALAVVGLDDAVEAAADAGTSQGGPSLYDGRAFSPALKDPANGASPVRSIVQLVQKAMGLTDSGVEYTALPLGGVVDVVVEPKKVFGDAMTKTRGEVAKGAAIDDAEWSKVVDSVDVDLALLLVSVVAVVPLCKMTNVSPVLGFLAVGLLLNQEGVFSENREVDQFCELGIQFLLFEMGLELSVQRLKALGKYAFGLGLCQVVFGNLLFAAALLPPGDALGTHVLEMVQSGKGVDDLLQIRSPLEAIVVGFGLTLSSSALGLQLLSDRGMMTTRLGTASLGVLLFQDLAVVPFIIALPVLQKMQIAGDGAPLDVGLMAAYTATSFLDLGVLSVGGWLVAKKAYEVITDLECDDDVFVALSLLVLFGFSNASAAAGFSDSLGAFIAGLVLAGTPYAHDIIQKLRAFKGLFLSLFFVTIGTTIDVPLARDLFPIVTLMTAGLMAGKLATITALGPLTGLTWREALVAGAFLSQGGEFAFVIFGQATSGSGGALFPQNLDELLVVVVIVSMALTPLAVDASMAIAGPTLDLSPCESDPQDPDGSCDVAWEMAESYGQDLPEGESPVLGSEVEAVVEAKIIDSD
jgi:Kef-type K+ transport system membrane component KefB